MKVLCGDFVTESNANIPYLTDLTTYDLAFGQPVIDKMRVRDVFEAHGVEPIPSIWANAAAAGVIKRDAFDYIEKGFLEAVRAHIHEIDGIFLMLHGASEVEGLGSGDHHILAEIRKIVGT
jgi:microcystin degradation protein MlrC